MKRRYSGYSFGKYVRPTKRRLTEKQRARIAYNRGMAIRRRRRFSNVRTGGFMGQEVKFYDKSLVADSLNAPTDASGGEHDPSASTSLNTVTQGDGESQRDGRLIAMQSVQIKGVITINPQSGASTADGANTIMIAVVLDKQTNGAQLNSEDVYTNPGASASLAAHPFRNLQFSRRFKVLKTICFIMQNPAIANDTGATGGIITNGLHHKFDMFVNLRGMRCEFKGTTENISNVVDNSIHVIAYANSISDTPKISYNSRLRFTG